ncbi:MAG: PKD domain-containing protein [Rikenellaceae bacterium]
MKYLHLISLSIISLAFVSCEKSGNEENTNYSPYISKIYDYSPAPGQFVNISPEFETGDTKESLIAKIESTIVGKKDAGLVTLGGFGGYIVFGFDHTVENVKGERDIAIMGNAFPADYTTQWDGGSSEPGIIMVSKDDNGNGLPDDEWYEIAGSEYNDASTIKNYEITYYKPTNDAFEAIDEYIRWEDNQGNSGWKIKNEFNLGSYYPSWEEEDKLTFSGTLIAFNGEYVNSDQYGYVWFLKELGFGYADNAHNDDENAGFDIGWAVDANGNSVDLEGVDFVKVYTAINAEAGNLGEVSTDFSGAYDIHLESSNN